MEFNERLRTIRKEHGLTQAELAEKAGIAVNSVRLYESGKVIPKLDTIARIARAMGLTASDFVGGRWGDFQGGFCSEEEVRQDDREAQLIYYFQNLNEKGHFRLTADTAFSSTLQSDRTRADFVSIRL